MWQRERSCECLSQAKLKYYKLKLNCKGKRERERERERDGGGIKATILISKALESCSCEDQQIFADVSRGKK